MQHGNLLFIPPITIQTITFFRRLEVTYANNAALIKKYENMPSHFSTEPKTKKSSKKFAITFARGANNSGKNHADAF
jgi:hypothetical protein